MKYIRKTSGLLFLCFYAITAAAQTDHCITRKSFAAKSGDWLTVTGKYGEIKINSTAKDSIIVCSTINIRQKDPALLEKSMSMIKTLVEKRIDTLSVKTFFDETFFTPPYNTGRTSFHLDYAITVPKGINLKINNSFGDVYVDNCDGSADISVSHGNLYAGILSRGNIKPVNSINADFGSITIDKANWVTITAINCPTVSLGKVQAAVITSRFSRISFGTANSIVVDSKSDIFNIESVNNVVMQSTYTVFVAGDLKRQMVAETNYGSIVISELSRDFSLVDLKNTQTPVTINVQNDASFIADISLSGSAIDIPFESNPSLHRQDVNGITKISGYWGKKMTNNSVVRINAHRGIIQIKDL
jgi:hypothetical protein